MKSEKIKGGEEKVREKRREKRLSVRSRNRRNEKDKRWREIIGEEKEEEGQ